MNLDKWKLTVLTLVGSAFTIFGIWQISIPVDEALVGDIVNMIFVIIGLLTNGITAAMTPKPKGG